MDMRVTKRPFLAVPALLAGTAAVAILAAWPPALAPAAAPVEAAAAIEMPMGGTVSLADAVALVLPAVVAVEVTRAMPVDDPRRSHGGPGRRSGPPPGMMPGPRGMPNAHPVSQGSGFVIDSAGLIVTNNHVVSGARQITVAFDDGRSYPATLIGGDPKTDLALLQVEAEGDFPYVTFGDSDSVRVGDWVFAVGNPFGLGGTVTTGIVSARGRDIGAGPYDDFLQIDAPINRGNSGGPTFDLSGRVVGVNTAILSPSGGNVGIGFAVPAAMARDVIDDLRDDGRVERGWLGVQIQPVTEEIAASLDLETTHGAIVAVVEPGSPAEDAGIAPGDVLLEIDGEVLESVRDVTRTVARIDPGTQTTFRVWRDGDVVTLTGRIEAWPGSEPPPRMSSDQGGAPSGLSLGLGLAALAPDDPRAEGLAGGVLVTDIVPGSEAADKGIRPGDVITAVGSRRIQTPSDVGDGVSEARERGRDAVLFAVVRNGDRRYVGLSLAES